MMTTHFITAEIDVQESPLTTRQAVEEKLQEQGDPLRWAITNVDEATGKATVEAIVTRDEAEATAPNA